MTDWPLVDKNDDGIRPAGNPDECFYCNQKVGQPHKKDCVCVTKIVKVKYTITIGLEVPHSWDKKMIEFHRNEATWCQDNVINDIEKHIATQDCLCGDLHCEYIETINDTPKRKIRVKE